MRPVWLVNLKDWLTGTTVGGKNGIDVNIINTTVPIAPSSLVYAERRFHDASLTTIPASSSNPVQLDVVGASTPANVSGTRTQMAVNWNGGAAIEILKGATAGAAVAIAAFGAGQTRAVGVSLANGDKIWVRAVQNVTVTTGELMVVLEA
jgi:hypothetical protein